MLVYVLVGKHIKLAGDWESPRLSRICNNFLAKCFVVVVRSPLFRFVD